MTVDQRQHSRYKCAGVATLCVSPDKPAYGARIIDLSLEGSLVELREASGVVCGDRVELAFDINHLPFRVRAEVRVVRSEKVLGLHFRDVTQRARERLEEVIRELAVAEAARSKERMRARLFDK